MKAIVLREPVTLWLRLDDARAETYRLDIDHEGVARTWLLLLKGDRLQDAFGGWPPAGETWRFRLERID